MMCLKSAMSGCWNVPDGSAFGNAWGVTGGIRRGAEEEGGERRRMSRWKEDEDEEEEKGERRRKAERDEMLI